MRRRNVRGFGFGASWRELVPSRSDTISLGCCRPPDRRCEFRRCFPENERNGSEISASQEFVLPLPAAGLPDLKAAAWLQQSKKVYFSGGSRDTTCPPTHPKTPPRVTVAMDCCSPAAAFSRPALLAADAVSGDASSDTRETGRGFRLLGKSCFLSRQQGCQTSKRQQGCSSPRGGPVIHPLDSCQAPATLPAWIKTGPTES